eukprot:gene14512-17129_t
MKGYPDASHYDYGGSSPSPPNMYSPIYRAIYPSYGHYQPSRYMDAAEEEAINGAGPESKMAPFYAEMQQRLHGRIQFLEEDLMRKKETIDGLQNQLSKYEHEKHAEKKKQSRYWTPDEHNRFLEALTKYGHKDVKAISNFVGTRNATQVRTHAQKYFLRIDRERQRKLDNKEGGDSKDDDNSWLRQDEYNDESGSPQYSSNNSPLIAPSSPFPSPTSSNNSPIKRKRETVLVTASQAKNAPLFKDLIMSMLPPQNWSSADYDQFSRGLISYIDIDDQQNSNSNTPEPNSPTHYGQRSPNMKRRPPPVNVPRGSELPASQVTPTHSPGMYSPNYPGSPMLHHSTMLHPPSPLTPVNGGPGMPLNWPRSYHEYRRLPEFQSAPPPPTHPGSNGGYFSLHPPAQTSLGDSTPHSSDDSPIGHISPSSLPTPDAHPRSGPFNNGPGPNWSVVGSPYAQHVDPPANQWSMNQTINSFTNASISNGSNNQHSMGVTSHD